MAANRKQRRAAAKKKSPGRSANNPTKANPYLPGGPRLEAEGVYKKALKFNSRDTDALIGLAQSRFRAGDRAGAFTLLEKAIAINAGLAPAHYLLATGLVEEGDHPKAVSHYHECVRLDPDNVEYRRRLGDLLTFIGQVSDAVEQYRSILALEPENAVVLNNLGMICLRLNLFDEAIDTLKRAAALDAGWISNFLLSLNYSPTLPSRRIFEEHRDAGNLISQRAKKSHRGDVTVSSPHRRLRIGFMSPDFRSHSVAYFIEPVLAARDPDTVETFCYAEVATPDEKTKSLRAIADHWYSTVGKSDDEVRGKICSDGIDVLIDLAGHTRGNRLGVFALRAAPVQATWIGYPNTTGLAEMDFRITDTIGDPPGASDELATETLIRLPDGFLCYRADDAAPEVVDTPYVAKKHVTFGSFNNSSKINERVVAVWARAMAQVPNSRMLLKYSRSSDAELHARIDGWFANHGIEKSRVQHRGWSPTKHDHFATYGEVDIALDSYPYNGTTTTCEALWMGVPVVTLAGDRHASRVSASLLNAVGMSKLVASNDDDFVAIIRDLARKPDELADLRRRLRPLMQASKLMDEKNFVRELEQAFHRMIQLKSGGLRQTGT